MKWFQREHDFEPPGAGISWIWLFPKTCFLDRGGDWHDSRYTLRELGYIHVTSSEWFDNIARDMFFEDAGFSIWRRSIALLASPLMRSWGEHGWPTPETREEEQYRLEHQSEEAAAYIEKVVYEYELECEERGIPFWKEYGES